MIPFSPKQKSVLVSVVLATFLTGCGGGDDTSSSPASSGIFPSNAVSATATDENAQLTTEVIVNGTSSIPDPTTLLAVSSDVNTSQANNQIEIAMKQFKKIKFKAPIALNETVNNSETINCQGGGTETIAYNMTLNEQTNVFSGTATMTSNQCNDGSSTTNGTIAVSLKCTIDANSEELLGCEYMNMSVGATGFYSGASSISQNSTFNLSNLSIVNGLWNSRLTASTVVTTAGKKYGLKDFVVDTKELSYTQASTDYVSGSIYFDQLLKYVTIDPNYDCTSTPFITNSSGGYISGECRFIGANNSKIRMYVENSKLMLAIDPEGDGTFEPGKEYVY